MTFSRNRWDKTGKSMNPTDIKNLVDTQRSFFHSNNLDYHFRREQLFILRQAIVKYENRILEALKADMGKPELEGYSSDIAFTLSEIDLALKKLKSWMKPVRVPTPLAHLPGSSYIHSDPYGVTLIMGPWNYPFNLVVAPLVGAMAAGNCAVLKPSELAPVTSGVITELFAEYFDPAYIAVVTGDVSVAQNLLAEQWDYIFFTGSPTIGKKVMAAAAQHLTPLTLELGGKSPCIIDQDVSLETATKRIVWGKFFNAGQTCIAPDYVMVHKSIKNEFIRQCKKTVTEFYGQDVSSSPDLARIINHNHFDRLTGLLENTHILVGGEKDRNKRYLSPTIVDGIDWDHPIMNEEIFGPILPVLDYEDLDSVIRLVNSKPKPLALYFFSNNKAHRKKMIKHSRSGGVCINDTINHIIPNNLPFGGVGNSGMGNYHGKASFNTFSHQKSNLNRSFLFDLDIKYAPYTLSLNNAKKLLKLMTG